ncbi:ABC transporter permease [Paenibacillus gansuensis]|uniref:ABC transporter permease n=1 Tax=Paenibacillus gansuensis TaxID=306542 RepID=A0ABW5PLB0_9BACL
MRTRAVVVRIIRQFIRDKRTMALMIAAPMLVLFLMSLVFGSDAYTPRIAVTSSVPAPVQEKLKAADAEISSLTGTNAEDALRSGDVDAVIDVQNQQLSVTLEGTDSSVNRAVVMLLQKLGGGSSPGAAGADGAGAGDAGAGNAGAAGPATQQPQIHYLYGSADLGTFDYVGPVMIGVFIFFFVFLIAGVSFLRERSKGTLERMLSTPLKRSEIVFGYVIGFGIFTSVQASIISWFCIHVLDMWMAGSFGYVLLVTLLLAMVALTLGILLSTFANNELQVVQFIPIVLVPQIFLSGLFSLDTMNSFLQGLSRYFPLTYGAHALKQIMLRGEGWSGIQTDVFVLVGFALAFMLLNIRALKKHRKL